MVVVIFTASKAFSQTDAEYKAKLEALNKEMAKNMLAGNIEKILVNYAADAISMPSYQPISEGIPAIRKSNEEMMKTGVKFVSFVPTIKKVFSSGNLVMEIGLYQMSMTMPGMEKPMEDHGKYLNIWEKQKDGSLKVKVETWNSDVDPMAAMGDMGKK